MEVHALLQTREHVKIKPPVTTAVPLFFFAVPLFFLRSRLFPSGGVDNELIINGSLRTASFLTALLMRLAPAHRLHGQTKGSSYWALILTPS